MFRALIGDLFASDAQTLVNTVNCVGVMGKGVAREFKTRFPEMFDDYAGRCKREEVRLGEPYLFKTLIMPWVLNFPTKGHWRAASRYADVEAGLDYLVAHYEAWGLKSLAVPPLGCGNGGLEWEQVGPLVYRKLGKLDIDIELYAPYGTPKTQLSEDFLAAAEQLTLTGKGFSLPKLNVEWVALMEVLRRLAHQPYANPVGRVIFQKICYVMTEIGVDTGFRFGKGSYGPYAADAKTALHDFANRNWIREESLGKMVAVRIGTQYEKDRISFQDVIEQHAGKIARTVDLFSRIKNTQQAEDVFTVMFASRAMRNGNKERRITEDELLDYITEWKSKWKTSEREQAIRDAIQQLVLLGWMNAEISEPVFD